jgi:glutathione S-transferase
MTGASCFVAVAAPACAATGRRAAGKVAEALKEALNMTRIVWGLGTPRTLRPLWALAELALDYDHRKILSRGSGMDDPHFSALTKRHKIPFFEDDIVKIGESAAIVTYLADRHGGDTLSMPAPGTAERAILLDRTLFIMTEIDARIYTIRLHDDPPQGLADIYGPAPAAVEGTKKYVEKSMRESVRWLEDGRPFILGEHFGTPDILLASCLAWAQLYNINLPTPLAEYYQRSASRPAFQAAMACNHPSNAEPDAAGRLRR